MTTTDHEYRERFIAGLRELADFLLAHPDVPLPSGDLRGGPVGNDDGHCMADVATVAAALGVEVTYLADDPQYPQAIRKFGPVWYVWRTALSKAMAHHDALMSYSGLVQPEPAEAGTR
jgi:hypothetical protein